MKVEGKHESKVGHIIEDILTAFRIMFAGMPLWWQQLTAWQSMHNILGCMPRSGLVSRDAILSCLHVKTDHATYINQ